MFRTFERDLSMSAKLWDAHVKHLYEDVFKCHAVSAETCGCGVCKSLDRTAGTDIVCVSTARQEVYGLATRVQPGVNWGSFTVRYWRESGVKTELEKRADDIRNVVPWSSLRHLRRFYRSGEYGRLEKP